MCEHTHHNTCKMNIGWSNEEVRRHCWDHSLLYACHFGYLTTDYEDINNNNKNRHKHPTKSVACIDKLMYDKAWSELPTYSSSRFPPSLCLSTLFAKPQVCTSPKKKVMPPPKKKSPEKSVFHYLSNTAARLLLTKYTVNELPDLLPNISMEDKDLIELSESLEPAKSITHLKTKSAIPMQLNTIQEVRVCMAIWLTRPTHANIAYVTTVLHEQLQKNLNKNKECMQEYGDTMDKCFVKLRPRTPKLSC